MIVGAAVVPTAPLFVPRVGGRLSEGLDQVAQATTAALQALPPHDLAILVATASAAAVHAEADASLAGIGRPDVRLVSPVEPECASVLADVTGQPLAGEAPLPLGLAVLVHLYAAARTGPVVPVAVTAATEAAALESAGWSIAAAVGERRAVAVVAGDLSAGLTERSPLALVDGARLWDDAVVDIVASGRIGRLRRYGPAAAARVGSLGWAPLVVLHGVCAQARLGTVLRRYAAPRGVGYLVASAG